MPDDQLMKPYPTPPETLDAMKNIMEHSQHDVARLPEPLFAQKLLPVLVDQSGQVDLTIWLDIAGHGFRPIDVFNPANGEVLFRVPSLYVEQKVGKPVNGRGPISMIVEEANRKSNQHPAIGQTYLRTQLANRPVDPVIDYDRIRTWNNILARYGHPPVIDLGVKLTDEAKPDVATGRLIASEEQEDF